MCCFLSPDTPGPQACIQWAGPKRTLILLPQQDSAGTFSFGNKEPVWRTPLVGSSRTLHVLLYRKKTSQVSEKGQPVFWGSLWLCGRGSGMVAPLRAKDRPSRPMTSYFILSPNDLLFIFSNWDTTTVLVSILSLWFSISSFLSQTFWAYSSPWNWFIPSIFSDFWDF